jgi:CsoR family transcriptional regulator, copper-sensing transcriptional repressor
VEITELESTEVESVIRRLRKIEGQVRGLQRSLAEGADCEQVLRQFAAASNALRSAGMVLAVSALEHCLVSTEDAGQPGDPAVRALESERFRKAILGLV